MKIDSSKAVNALVASVRELSEELPGAEEYVMVHHPAFRVKKKPFVIIGMDEAEKGATLTINWGPDAQAMFLADKRFSRTHYIGQHGWVTITASALKKGELKALVVKSYERVAPKPKRAPAKKTLAKKKAKK